MKIISVVGARPNFMKIAPFCRAIDEHNLNCETKERIHHILVHTGQHYDARMSESFFEELSIPRPDINLEIGSGTHAEQVGNTMIAFEKVLKTEKPDWVVVVGDVNATCACSITAKKEGVKLAHIEAGLRSFDLGMPEEINRMVTDRLSDLLFTPCRFSNDNLRAEGVPEEKIKFVGNIMVDTLYQNLDKAKSLEIRDVLSSNYLEESNPDNLVQICEKEYALLTMHRPSNVDHEDILKPLIEYFVDEVSKKTPIVWPIHPRTRKQLEKFKLWDAVLASKNIHLLHPLSYHQLLRLNLGAKLVFTDSGGLQEECCITGIPCVTMRDNTERPITLIENGGVSVLTGPDCNKISSALNLFNFETKRSEREGIPFWDGLAAERIVKTIDTL